MFWRLYGWKGRICGGPLSVEARFVDEVPQISSLRCIQNRYPPILLSLITFPDIILSILEASPGSEIVTLTCSTMLQVFSSQ